MATVYHRDQPGAPALTYGPNSQVGFNALKAIVKACLVDGYPGRPAAGWALINEGADFIVLRNGALSGFVCFTLVSGVVRVYLADTYTGMAGNIMTGAGVKSGNASGSTVPQAVNIPHAAAYPSSSTWVVIADEKTAVLAIYGHNNSANVLMTDAPYSHSSFTLCIGEDSLGRFLCAGGGASTNTSNVSSVLAYDGGFTALKNPVTGLLLGADALALYIPAASATTASATANAAAAAAAAALPEVALVPISWTVAGAAPARLRGIALCPAVQAVTYPSTAAQYLGRPGPMYVRDGNQPIDLGDGNSYFVRAGHYYSMFWLITDNPEFW